MTKEFVEMFSHKNDQSLTRAFKSYIHFIRKAEEEDENAAVRYTPLLSFQ